jgi:hypothetical protein
MRSSLVLCCSAIPDFLMHLTANSLTVALLEQSSTTHAAGVGSASIASAPFQVSVDVMLDLLVDAWCEQRAHDKRAIEAACRAHAASGHGVHSPADLREVLRHVNKTTAKMLPERVVIELFREAVRRGGGGGTAQPAAVAEVRNYMPAAGMLH